MKDYAKLLASKPLFDQYVARRTYQLSTFHFSSLLAWSDFFDFTFEVIDDNLCVFARHAPGNFLYLPPLGGEVTLPVAEQCLSRMSHSSRGVARIENLEEAMCGLFAFKPFDIKKKADEYVYRKANITALAGGAYKAQRHDINRLMQHHKPVYGPYIHEQHFSACLDLYERWAQNRKAHCDDPIYQAMIDDNRLAHERILQYHDGLGVIGRVLTIDSQVVAYSFGYPLNCDTFCVLLEVTDLSKTGLAALMFKRFCADDVWANYTFVNAMDDFGMPQVAQTKQAYHPVVLIPSYTLYPR